MFEEKPQNPAKAGSNLSRGTGPIHGLVYALISLARTSQLMSFLFAANNFIDDISVSHGSVEDLHVSAVNWVALVINIFNLLP